MNTNNKIGITERGDAALDTSWYDWVFKQHNPAILISKDPTKLYDEVIKGAGYFRVKPNIIVHCTITGMGGTRLEPNVPKCEKSLESYRKFVDYLGKDRVVLRIDPIVPTFKAVNLVIDRVLSQRCRTRVRISFMDFYSHVIDRFHFEGLDPHDFGFTGNFNAPLKDRLRWYNLIKLNMNGESDKLEVCGEPGIESIPCVSKNDCDILGVEFEERKWKQRWCCNCAGNKFELLNNNCRCSHKCLYCYWHD